MATPDPDDLRAVFNDLAKQLSLSDDVRRAFEQFSAAALRTFGESGATKAFAGVAEAYGTAYPATVRAESGTLTLEPVPAVPTTGHSVPAQPLAWRPDLFVTALVVFVVLSFFGRSFPEGLADMLRELCLLLLALGVSAALANRGDD